VVAGRLRSSVEPCKSILLPTVRLLAISMVTGRASLGLSRGCWNSARRPSGPPLPVGEVRSRFKDRRAGTRKSRSLFTGSPPRRVARRIVGLKYPDDAEGTLHHQPMHPMAETIRVKRVA
jgi:hypothetical protein